MTELQEEGGFKDGMLRDTFKHEHFITLTRTN